MNTIHPTAIIGDGVELGDGNVIGPFAVLFGPLRLGDGNWIGAAASLGGPPEVRGFEHVAQWVEPGRSAGLRIGDRNVIREQTVVHQGWKSETVIGDDCFLMNKTYIAHDTVLGDGVTLASTVTMGGHVHVGDGANVGLGTVVHQRRVVAPGAMVGMGSVVTKDIPPFALAYGNPALVRGANAVGMSRLGLGEDVIELVREAYAAGRVPANGDVPPALAAQFAWWQRETAS